METNSKIFTRNAIRIGTGLGSPLVAGYMMYINYKNFGKHRAANQALIIGIASTVLIFVFIFSLPNDVLDQIPYFLFPIIYMVLVDLLVRKFQQDDIDNFFENNGQKESNWKVAGITSISILLTLGVIALFAFFQPLYEGEVNSYGAQNHQIYFSNNVDPALTDSLAFSLAKIGYFTNHHQGNAHIGRRDEFYVITLPVQKTVWNDQGVLARMQSFKNELRSKFRTKSIIIRLHHFDFSKDEYKEL